MHEHILMVLYLLIYSAGPILPYLCAHAVTTQDIHQPLPPNIVASHGFTPVPLSVPSRRALVQHPMPTPMLHLDTLSLLCKIPVIFQAHLEDSFLRETPKQLPPKTAPLWISRPYFPPS